VTSAAPTPDGSTTERLIGELSALVGRVMLVARGGEEGPALTTTQRLALFELNASEALRLNELAERIVTSPPTASRAVDALVSLGFVERVPDPADRRAVQIRVTDYGRGRVAERVARVGETLDPALRTLPAADRERLVILLARLNSALAGPSSRRR
jgi:DNA-binding MarR family transcriptional regulator